MKRRACNLYSVIIGALILIVICMGLGTFIASAHESTDDTVVYKYYKSIQIQPGDTLWNIAEETITSEYDSTAEYVSALKKMNSLTSDDIQAGQYLTVAYTDTAYKE
ncbi:LysM peptidoglycan-binding domain-containing protein [Mediterraneibacter glycyrrhizinilyticus]|uniref:LysM peptidoglycan-binding domain-containing protein n=1 Tax=Mediterraneibacter glycyrrhizinilyticus TaxID=342942 RepID=UPI001960D3B5|nr:LysM peptidoglycan-binding domain-containing protein [Mediterraneibacter glycyrrhizinilyticus]MBM6750571.1 LysM peptidoglycan-binding domain-containing protein [Mediterraneibacter glycyrrhizinilyticus]